MPGILATSAQQPILAQESPVQQWLSGWLAYLSENLPVLFVVLTILVGTILLVRGGGFKEAISFVLGALVIFVVLMNLELFADLLRDELPLQAPTVDPSPASDYGAGLALTVYSVVLARRAAVWPRPDAGGGQVTNQIHGGQFTGPVVQGRDLHAGVATTSPEQPDTGAGADVVTNRIEGGTFGGPVLQGRDMHGLVPPPPGDADTQAGWQGRVR